MARAVTVPGALALTVMLGLASASCGGGKGPGDGGGGGSGGDTSGGGGGSGSGGGGDTSGGGGSGSGGGGDTSGGGSGGGTGSGGGGSPCDGLGATAGAAVARRYDVGTHAWCERGTSNPNGQVALGFLSGSSSMGSFLFYPPDGSAAQGRLDQVFGSWSGDIDPWFHWTSSGWAAIVHDAPPPPVAFRSFDGTGGVIATTTDAAVSSAPDPHGGTVLLARPFTVTGSVGTFGPTRLQWLDGRGGLLRSVTLDADPTMLLVNWGTDHVLTLLPDATGLRVRWWDGQGTPLTPWFFAGSVQPVTMHLLVDGTIAVGDAAGWRGIFRDGVAAMDPPPAWLAARPGTRLATIRGGRGYAVLPPPDGAGLGGAGATLEIVAATGESCGTVALPPPPDEPGVTHRPTALDVGQDGTVFQAEDLIGTSLGMGIHCGFRWWPALLR